MQVIVVGAGAAGCTAAWRLREAGHDVALLEREAEVGGRTRTLRRDGFEIDRGAAFITSRYDSTLKLLKALGRRGDLSRWKPKIGFRNGDQIDYLKPDSMISRMSFSPISMRAGWRLTREMMRSTPDIFNGVELAEADDGVSVAGWGPRAVGEQAYEYGIRTAVEPFWGAAPEDVPAAAARGVLGSSIGQKLLQVSGGTGAICEWLAEDDFEPNTTVELVESDGKLARAHLAGGQTREADAVVVATDARIAAKLLDGHGAEQLNDYSYAANLHVALAFDSEVWPQAGGDLVFEVGPGERTVTSYAPLSRRRPAGLLGGSELIDVYFGDRASRRLDRDAAVAAAISAVERHLDGPLPAPAFEEVINQPLALSAPRPGELAGRTELVLPANVAVAGDHIAMAAVETAVRSGEVAARKLQLAG